MTDVAPRTPRIAISADPPDNPTPGNLWWSPVTGQQCIWYDDGNTKQWVVTNWGSGRQGPPGTQVFISDTPPLDPEPTTLWWSSANGKLYIWYDDGNSSQWVPASPNSDASGSNAVIVSDTPPTPLHESQLWWSSVLGQMFIWYNDGSSTQWVPTSPSGVGSSAQSPVFVESFGVVADWDGTDGTDNWLALQTAVDSDRPLMFRSNGAYAFGRQIILREGTTMTTDGGQATLVMLTGTSMFDAEDYVPGLELAGMYGAGVDNVKLRSLKFVMQPHANIRTCFPVALTDSKGHRLVDIEATGFKEMFKGALHFNNVNDVEIVRPYVHDCYSDSNIIEDAPAGPGVQITGITFDTDGNVTSNNYKIIEPRFENLYFGPLAIAKYGYQTDGISLLGNQALPTPPALAGGGGTITSPYVKNVYEGIDNYADRIAITNIAMTDVFTGVALKHGASHCTISGGYIYRTFNHAIAINGSNNSDGHVKNSEFNVFENLLMHSIGDLEQIDPLIDGASAIAISGSANLFHANNNTFRNITTYNTGRMKFFLVNDGGDNNIVEGCLHRPATLPWNIKRVDDRVAAGNTLIIEPMTIDQVTIGSEVSGLTDLTKRNSVFVNISGNNTITDFGTGTNLLRHLTFFNSLTIVHDPVKLILLGGQDIDISSGDKCLFYSDSSGNWTQISHTRADGMIVSLRVSPGLPVIGMSVQNRSTVADTEVIVDLSPNDGPAGQRSAQISGVTNGSTKVKMNFKTSNSDVPAIRMSLDHLGFLNLSNGSFGRGVPVIKAAATINIDPDETWIINNYAAGTVTVTLPVAADWPGRELTFQNYQPQAMISSLVNNVTQIGGTTTSSDILSAVDGANATLVSDGVRWLIMAGNP